MVAGPFSKITQVDLESGVKGLNVTFQKDSQAMISFSHSQPF